jgi:hypothetical protein
MQSNFIVAALATLALAGPGITVSAPMGSGGGGGSYGGSSSGSTSSTSSSSSGSGTSSGSGSSGGSSSGGHGGGGGRIGGLARGGMGAGSHFTARVGGTVAGYGIHLGPHNGGQGAPAIQALTHGAAHAVRIEDRTRPAHPGTPKVRPNVRTRYCFGGSCQSQSTMSNLYCVDPRIDDLFTTPLDCPRALKTRDMSDPGMLIR